MLYKALQHKNNYAFSWATFNYAQLKIERLAGKLWMDFSYPSSLQSKGIVNPWID